MMIPTYTAIHGEQVLSSGGVAKVALAVKAASSAGNQPILIFDDQSGQQLDFDLRGSDQDVTDRLTNSQSEIKRPGRPKLGVVSREVTLLPRHWEWLANQPGGASVTLRKLIDAARPIRADVETVRKAQQASDRVMLALLGNQPGYEEASRALYAKDLARFQALSEPWPVEIRDYVRRLAAPAFASASSDKADNPAKVSPAP